MTAGAGKGASSITSPGGRVAGGAMAETAAAASSQATAKAAAVRGAAGGLSGASGVTGVSSGVGGVSGGGSWGRRAGLAGATLGLVAAGVAVERLTVNRTVRRKARLALDATGPYGSLRGTPGTAYAEDGTELYYETDEPGEYEGENGDGAGGAAAAAGDGAGGPTVEPVRIGSAEPEEAEESGEAGEFWESGQRGAGSGDSGSGGDPGSEASGDGSDRPGAQRPTPQRNRLLRLLGRRHGRARRPSTGRSGSRFGARSANRSTGRSGRRLGGGDRQPDDGGTRSPTVVFTHGYCLSQDVWHFQRAALRGAARAVYWDQRSHGRSGRATRGEAVTIDRLGRDLKAVLDAAVPEGPIVLVGHSMGGMTVMALADQYPDFVAERVTGVALIDTSAGGLGEVTYGLPLPSLGVKAVRRAVPGVLRAMVAQSALVERGRRATADLLAGLVKRYSFGDVRDVDPGVARFAERLIEAVPIDVVAEFYPAFEAHEKTAALAAFDGRPALVLAGERDLLTPYAHSEAIAAALPSARLLILERTGHLAMLERPHEVNEALAELIARSLTGD